VDEKTKMVLKNILMKKILLVFLISMLGGGYLVHSSVPYHLQVVNPVEDIKSMYENELYKEIIDQYSGKPRTLSAMELIYVAQSYLQLEDLENATIFAQMATKKDPRYARAYYVDGVVTNMIGNYSQAINKLRRAITLSPDESDYYIALGDVYYVQEKYNNALEEYKNALKVSKPSEKAYYMVAVAYMALNEEKQGLEAFYTAKEKTVKDKELYVTVLYNVGKTEYDLKRYKVALLAYKELMEYFPDDYYSCEKIVQCYNALGEYDEADTNKKVLYTAYINGRLNGSSLADMFCTEIFNIGNKEVSGYERYEGIGDKPMVKNIFYVTDERGNIESSIFLEYDPTPATGDAPYNFVMTKDSKRHACAAKYAENTSYTDLKQSIKDIISGKVKTTPID